MADEVDIANDLAMAELENRLAAARKAPTERGPEFCEECEQDMPELRRSWGLKLCVECASAAERRNSLYAMD